jgi:hypothetical protein
VATHLEERDEVRLGSLLQRHDGRGLEAQIGLYNGQQRAAEESGWHGP